MTLTWGTVEIGKFARGPRRCERYLLQIQDLETVQLFFALLEVEGREVGAPLVGRGCPCFSSLPMGHTWSLFY